MASTHMILADAKLSAKDAKAMMDEIETVDGVKYAIGFNQPGRLGCSGGSSARVADQPA